MRRLDLYADYDTERRRLALVRARLDEYRDHELLRAWQAPRRGSAQ